MCAQRGRVGERLHIIFIRSNPDTSHARKRDACDIYLKNKSKGDIKTEKECAKMNVLNHL